MKTGEEINANTHLEFLNELLGKDYKGWTNTKVNEDVITEELTEKQVKELNQIK